MNIDTVTMFLTHTKYKEHAAFITAIYRNNTALQDIFSIGNGEIGRFAVKIRDKTKRYLVESLENLRIMNDSDNLFNRYDDIYETEEFYLLISKWIEGKNPADSDKEIIELFKKLARFNMNNISYGKFTSMYCDGKTFNSIEEMVDSEVSYHQKFWKGKNLFEDIKMNIEPLKNGLPCLINEDLNIWNIMIREDGDILFIDTEWLQKSINLYQFDHLRIWEFDTGKPYSINDLDKKYYRTYFKEFDLSIEEVTSQIKAIEILKVIRQNTFWRFYKMNEYYGQEVERIKAVLECQSFI